MKKILFAMLLSMSIGVQVFAQDELELKLAIKTANTEKVKQLLPSDYPMQEKGASLIVDAISSILPNDDRNTYKNIIQFLMNAGADIDGLVVEYKNRKTTPLKTAIKHVEPEIVKYLIEHGADVNTQFDTQDPTPLQWAAMNLCQYMVHKKEPYGEIKNQEYMQWMRERQDDLYNIMRILIDRGAKKNSPISILEDCRSKALHPEEIQKFIDLLKE